jgi:hypothetical protein
MIPLHRQPRMTDSATDSHGDESPRIAMYRALIGEQATDYYLDQFSRFDEQLPTENAWNWAALLFTFPWLIHRKMWGRAFLYLLLPFAYVITLGTAQVLLPTDSLFAVIVFVLAYLIFLFGMIPRIADRQYHAFCSRKIDRAHRVSPQLHAQVAWLKRRGGTTNMAIVWLVSLLAFVAISGCFETIRQFGQRRGDMDMAYLQTKSLTQAITSYYALRQILPETLADIGYKDLLPDELDKLDYDAHTGVITATLALHGLQGKHLVWTPSTPYYIELKWTCSSPDIPDFYLPQSCKPHVQKPTSQ